jgi:hypothetical protein
MTKKEIDLYSLFYSLGLTPLSGRGYIDKEGNRHEIADHKSPILQELSRRVTAKEREIAELKALIHDVQNSENKEIITKTGK